VKTEAPLQSQNSICLVSAQESLRLSCDVGIGHVLVGKTEIGDRQQEKAETEGVPRNAFR
jgi:hypothetical protein